MKWCLIWRNSTEQAIRKICPIFEIKTGIGPWTNREIPTRSGDDVQRIIEQSNMAMEPASYCRGVISGDRPGKLVFWPRRGDKLLKLLFQVLISAYKLKSFYFGIVSVYHKLTTLFFWEGGGLVFLIFIPNQNCFSSKFDIILGRIKILDLLDIIIFQAISCHFSLYCSSPFAKFGGVFSRRALRTHSTWLLYG